MSAIQLRHHDLALSPQSARVLIRPFIPSGVHRITTIIGRAMSIPEESAEKELVAVLKDFDTRHLDLESTLLANFERVALHVFTHQPLSRTRKLLIGALFSGEYALESAALFNPSIVQHPNQEGVPEGGLRFIMSLRATGEGHISSVEFRTGLISSSGDIEMDPVSTFVTVPEINPNPSYKKLPFLVKLHEMNFDNLHTSAVMQPLGKLFSRTELEESMRRVQREHRPASHELNSTLLCIQWLADSNYEFEFSPHLALSERVLFPVSANESNGIEDARFVLFKEPNGSQSYYATYTAYNGDSIQSQLIETDDFLHFRVLTLTGAAVKNKGMALFPRRIGGNYAMLSRQDDENLYLMYSDNPHFWNEAKLLMRPVEMWESVKIGNCGSPIETEAGWLVITHGVGPMRKYCIGAALLDLEDPSKIIGRLREPLLVPEGTGREGYVPNVVYGCGSMLHGRNLILPYAMSDRASSVVTVPVDDLLHALLP